MRFMERGIEIRVFFGEGAQRAALVGGENRWIGRVGGAYGCGRVPIGCGGVPIGGEAGGLGGEVIFCVGKIVACVSEIIACVGAVVPVARRWIGPAGRTNAPPPLVGRKRPYAKTSCGVGGRKRLCVNFFLVVHRPIVARENIFFGVGRRNNLCVNAFRGVVGRIVASANGFLGVGRRKNLCFNAFRVVGG